MYNKIIGPFKEFGLGAGTLYCLARVLQSLSPKLGLFVYEMMVQPINSKPLISGSLSKNISFAEIGRGHPDLAKMPAPAQVIALRFDQGAVCLGAYVKGKLVGYIWLCFKQYEEDEVRCTYHLTDSEHSVFDFDLFVMPESRMGLGFVAVWQCANEYLTARGVKYSFSRLTRFNLASRRSHAHLGWKCAAKVVFFRASRLEVMFANVRPFLAMSWGEGSRTHLQLGPEVLVQRTAD